MYSTTLLKTDCKWWLVISNGAVNIAVLLTVSRQHRTIHIEAWELVPIPNQHISNYNPQPTMTAPTKTQEVNIAGTTVDGGPLIFDFEKVFARPIRSGEGDIILLGQDLANMARFCWESLG